MIFGDSEKRYLIHNQRNKYMYEYQKIDKNDFIGLIQSALKHCDIDVIWNIVQCVINNSSRDRCHSALLLKMQRQKLKGFNIRLLRLSQWL